VATRTAFSRSESEFQLFVVSSRTNLVLMKSMNLSFTSRDSDTISLRKPFFSSPPVIMSLEFKFIMPRIRSMK
jgi:hypothetical protein